MKSRYLAGLGLAVVVVASCADEPLRCGPGTRRVGDECVIPAEPSQTPGGNNSSGNSGGGQSGDRSTGDDAGLGGDHAQVGGGGEPETSGGAAGDDGAGGSGGGGLDQTGLITTAMDCQSRDVTGATVITEPITQDTTWSGVIHLPKGLTVRNEPTLTIAPGTKVIVGHGATVEFGWLGSHATIVANGTIEQPIKFCGETDSAGYWAGLIFRSGIKSASILRNVLISDGGSLDAGLSLEMPLLVQGVQVRNSGENGVNAVGFGPLSSTLIVSGSAKAAVKATAVRGAEVPRGSQLTGNGLDLIDLAFTSFDADVTLRDAGVPYRQLSDTGAGKADKPPLVTIEAGVVYSIAKQKRLDFGFANVHALGSEEEPIVFQGLVCPQPDTSCPGAAAPNTVDAGGRLLIAGADVRLEYVELRKLGSSTDAALSVGASTLKVDHLSILGAIGSGLAFSEPGKFNAGSHHLQVVLAQAGAALRLGCGQLATLPSETTISSPVSSNVYTAADCMKLETSSTWPSSGSPYSISGLEIAPGASLTLSPGTTLRIAPSSQLLVDEGSTLNAIGSATSKIQFLAEGPSNWAGIYADSGSSVQLDYVVVDRAGAGTSGSAIVAKSVIALTNSTISNSSSWGLKKAAADPTNYLTGNLFLANAGGNVTELP